MNPSIEHLASISAKKRKRIVGLMSGTSLDGLDIALCNIAHSGRKTVVEVEQFETISYPAVVKQKLKKIISVSNVMLEDVCLAHTWLAGYHADLILEKLADWNIEPLDVDAIASHGQTIFHAPAIQHQREGLPNATLQIGDGDHIAKRTGILTVSDFRQKHTAAGGEGAPMVSFVDEMLFRDPQKDRLLINIGGITNLTYLPAEESGKSVIAGDTGPGNTLIDAAARHYFDQPFDENGNIADSGTVHPQLFNRLMDHPFLSKSMPKTTGPEEFHLGWVEQIIKEEETSIGEKDIIATLCWFTAQTLADAIQKIADLPAVEIYMSGGGMKNKQLIKWISHLLDGKELHSFEEIGFDPDAKEAVSFAVLANETLSGEGFVMNPKMNAGRRVNFGKISLPV